MSLPMQYATTSDGVRIAFMSLGSGPPVVFASNIFGELNGYRVGWPTAGRSPTGWSPSDGG